MSNPAVPPRSLAEALRARDDASLAALLCARPDLITPVPTDLTQLATRVSVNFETPCGATLAPIAPEKNWTTTKANFERVRTQVVREREARAHGRPPDPLHPNGVAGMTMQFVVGATPDSDRTIMDRVTSLYAGGGIHHAHFSAFRPIRDTPMEGAPAPGRCRCPGAVDVQVNGVKRIDSRSPVIGRQKSAQGFSTIQSRMRMPGRRSDGPKRRWNGGTLNMTHPPGRTRAAHVARVSASCSTCSSTSKAQTRSNTAPGSRAETSPLTTCPPEGSTRVRATALAS